MNYMRMWNRLKGELLKDKEANKDLLMRMSEIEVEASMPDVLVKDKIDLAVYEACKKGTPIPTGEQL